MKKIRIIEFMYDSLISQVDFLKKDRTFAAVIRGFEFIRDIKFKIKRNYYAGIKRYS